MEFFIFIAFALMLAPWIVAVGREHPHHGAILALVLLLGWTGIGWIAAWVWTYHPPTAVKASRNSDLRLVPGGGSSEPQTQPQTEAAAQTESAARTDGEVEGRPGASSEIS